MSRRVFSRGRVIGGTASLASICEFVEFTFIGIFKTDDTPKTCRFSTRPPVAETTSKSNSRKKICHKKVRVFYVQPGRQSVPVFSNQTARVRDCVRIRDGWRDTNNRQ